MDSNTYIFAEGIASEAVVHCTGTGEVWGEVRVSLHLSILYATNSLSLRTYHPDRGLSRKTQFAHLILPSVPVVSIGLYSHAFEEARRTEHPL